MNDNQLQVFMYNNQNVRTTNINGDAWFAGKDICDILGIQNIRQNIKSLDDDEKMTVYKTYGQTEKQRGGARFMTFVSEPGLYKLIFRSNKPEAKEFTRWVTHTLLPQVHHYGMYLTPRVREIYEHDPVAFSKLIDRYLDIDKENEALKTENSMLKISNANLLERLAQEQAYSSLGHFVVAAPSSIPVKDASNVFGQYNIKIGQNSFYKLGRDLNLLCSRKGVQWNKPTQKAIEMGIFGIEISDGFNVRTMVTPIGLKYFCGILMRKEYPLFALI